MAYNIPNSKPKEKKNKWKYIFVIQGNYGQGWEDLTEEEHYLEGRERLKEYEENEPEYPHRKIMRKVLAE